MSTFIKTLSYTSMKQPLHEQEVSTLLLDTSAWPNDDSANFGGTEINELFDHFNALLEKKTVMFKVLTKSGSF